MVRKKLLGRVGWELLEGYVKSPLFPIKQHRALASLMNIVNEECVKAGLTFNENIVFTPGEAALDIYTSKIFSPPVVPVLGRWLMQRADLLKTYLREQVHRGKVRQLQGLEDLAAAVEAAPEGPEKDRLSDQLKLEEVLFEAASDALYDLAFFQSTMIGLATFSRVRSGMNKALPFIKAKTVKPSAVPDVPLLKGLEDKPMKRVVRKKKRRSSKKNKTKKSKEEKSALSVGSKKKNEQLPDSESDSETESEEEEEDLELRAELNPEFSSVLRSERPMRNFLSLLFGFDPHGVHASNFMYLVRTTAGKKVDRRSTEVIREVPLSVVAGMAAQVSAAMFLEEDELWENVNSSAARAFMHMGQRTSAYMSGTEENSEDSYDDGASNSSVGTSFEDEDGWDKFVLKNNPEEN